MLAEERRKVNREDALPRREPGVVAFQQRRSRVGGDSGASFGNAVPVQDNVKHAPAQTG